MPSITALLIRFWMGLAGGLAGGLLIFRMQIFDPGSPAFDFVTIGMLVAGVVALQRAGRGHQAFAIAVAYSLFRFSLISRLGWLNALAGCVMALGVVLAAIVFDRLAQKGFRFGKFLVLGPLVGGLYVATTPMIEFSTFTLDTSLRSLLYYGFLGIILGDGVGFGVELADLLEEVFGPDPAETA